MWKWIALGTAGLAIVVFGFSLIDTSAGEVGASAVLANINNDISGFTRAVEPLDWSFPQDFGAHPDYQTEWWYYTGNVMTEEGRRFGYQFTVFRRAILPTETDTKSEWRTNQIYMAHFTVTDVENQKFYHFQRFSRGAADLAGVTLDPRYRVWLEDWEVLAQNDEATLTQVTAATDEVAVNLLLEQTKPPALQGEGGLSQKSEDPGNASQYYSLSRLITRGTLRVGDETFTVSGATWKDHEFSTSALGSDAQGWDWFGLHLDDDRELMLGQIRLVEGGRDPVFGGLLVLEDGTTRKLESGDFTITPTSTWVSPHTGAEYPAGWQISIDIGENDPLDLTLTPLVPDQELTDGIAYWEGAVEIGGDVTGHGYAELTGYVGTMNGRF